jgi:hypothetical protein
LNFGDNLRNDASAKYWVYYTYTHQITGTDIAIDNAAGTTAEIVSTTTSFVQVLDNEEFLVSGFATGANNGLYRATANGTATGVLVEKADSGDEAFVDEAAGATVVVSMNPYGSASAILVDDNSAADMSGTVSAQASVQRTFNYDGNVQGGRAFGVNAAITAVGIGLSTGQFVKTTGTIARSTANSVSLVAALERNYANPV